MARGKGDNIDRDAIASLRRQRRAALGKAARARDTVFLLRCKARDEDERAERLAREIEGLGGTVRR